MFGHIYSKLNFMEEPVAEIYLDKGNNFCDFPFFFRCKISKTVTLDGAVDALKNLEDIRIGKVVVKI